MSKQIYNGFGNTSKSIKRTDKICPRCYKHTVNKIKRTCDSCKGRLLWNGDSIDKTVDDMIGFYMWTKSVYNQLEGWYPESYFGISYDIRNVKTKPPGYNV